MSRLHDRHANWIDGEWRPAATRATFVPARISPGSGSPDEWPRSGAREVEDALRAVLSAGDSWARRTDRDARVDAFLDDLRAVPIADLARDLGLSQSELSEEIDDAIADYDEREPSEPSSGAVLVYSDWRELFDGLSDLTQSLAAGRTIVFVSDPAVPGLGETLAVAAAGLPKGVFNVLHDDRRSVLRALITSGELSEVQASGSSDLLDDLTRYAEKIAPARRLCALFGAGVMDDAAAAVQPDFELRTIANSSIVVGQDADPVSEARYVFAHSVGRPCALGGLRSGQIGRVLCHEGVFSRFSEELLALFDNADDAEDGFGYEGENGAEDRPRGAVVVDETLAEHLLRARELGLDEGATLVWEGPRGRLEAGLSHSERSSGSRGRLADVTVGRTVFTNVEEHMQLARLSRPAPLVCLMRVPSESVGAELAARLDASGG